VGLWSAVDGDGLIGLRGGCCLLCLRAAFLPFVLVPAFGHGCFLLDDGTWVD